MIRFECPSCGRNLKAPADRVGSRCRCPSCRKSCEIPASDAKPETATVVEYSTEKEPIDDTPIARRKRKKDKPLLLVGVLACFAVILTFAFIAIASRASKAEKLAAEAKAAPPPATTTVIVRDRSQRFEPVTFTPSEPTYERDRDRRSYQNDRDDDEEFDRNMGKLLRLMGLLTYIIFAILLAVWVVKDCRNRSIENGIFWMLLTFGFSVIALMIYMASRPNGSLIRCEHCGNRRLSYVGVCPHCGRAIQSHGMAPI